MLRYRCNMKDWSLLNYGHAQLRIIQNINEIIIIITTVNVILNTKSIMKATFAGEYLERGSPCICCLHSIRAADFRPRIQLLSADPRVLHPPHHLSSCDREFGRLCGGVEWAVSWCEAPTITHRRTEVQLHRANHWLTDRSHAHGHRCFPLGGNLFNYFNSLIILSLSMVFGCTPAFGCVLFLTSRYREFNLMQNISMSLP